MTAKIIQISVDHYHIYALDSEGTIWVRLDGEDWKILDPPTPNKQEQE